METDATLNKGAEETRADRFVLEIDVLGSKVGRAVGSFVLRQLGVVNDRLITLFAGGHARLVNETGLACNKD
tara:strand:+ start:162 stop:377 length:216 start_codon:yes stop_codon:yes gene_type:complete